MQQESDSLGLKSLLRKNAPPLAAKIFDRLLSAMPPIYNEILSEAEAHLLNCSRDADDDKDRALYIGAIEECGNKRNAMCSRFSEDLEQDIAVLFRSKETPKEEPGTGNKSSTPSFDLSSLSILDESDLQERIAVQKMVSNASKEFLVNGDIIDEGMANLVTNVVLDSTNNPFSLSVIGDSIFDSFSTANLDSRSKLLIYNLFKDSLFLQLEPLYREIADLLVEKGYATRAVVAQPASTSTQNSNRLSNLLSSQGIATTEALATNVSPGSSTNISLAEGDFAALAQLLNSASIPASFSDGGATGNTGQPLQLYAPPSNIDDNTRVVTVSNQEVDTMLRAIQDTGDNDSKLSVPEQLSVYLRSESSDDIYKVISRKAENNINLVSLLFEFIVENASIFPQALKQIMRLQIPFMRLALTAPTLFSGNNHSARRLLNQLADLGATVNSIDDSAYQIIVEIADCICVQTELTEKVFDKLNEELESFIEEDAERNEETSIRTEEEAREQQQIAYETAAEFLQNRLKNIEHSLIFHTLLERLWCELLSRSIIKDGMPKQRLGIEPGTDNELEFELEAAHESAQDDNNSWDQLVELFDWVLWSTQAGDNQQDKDKLLKTLAATIKRLTNSFKKYEMDEVFSGHFMDQMREIHLKVIKEKIGTVIADEQLDLRDKTESLLEEIAEVKKAEEKPAAIVIGRDHQDIPLPLSRLMPEVTEIQAAEDAASPGLQLEPLDDEGEELLADDPQLANTELTIDEEVKQVAPPIVAATKRPEVRDVIQQVGKLRTGDWLEYLVEGKPTRAKIAFYATYNEKFVFVDRQGHKLFERLKPELVVDIQDGYATVLDNTDTFDKALSAIIGSIRTQQTGQSA